MRRSATFRVGCALLAGLVAACVPASGQRANAARTACDDSAAVRRMDGESARAFVIRVQPGGDGLSHPVLEGDFGFTPRDILALYGTRAEGLQDGWVLTPAAGCPGWYRRHPLPITDVSLMGVAAPAYAVRAALRANADRDAARELVLILYAEGPGPADERGNRRRKHEHNVGVFDWDGTRFVYRPAVSGELYDLPTAGAVRRRLRALGY